MVYREGRGWNEVERQREEEGRIFQRHGEKKRVRETEREWGRIKGREGTRDKKPPEKAERGQGTQCAGGLGSSDWGVAQDRGLPVETLQSPR